MNALIEHHVAEKPNAKMHQEHSDVLVQMENPLMRYHDHARVLWHVLEITTVQETQFVLTEHVTVLNQMLGLIVKV